MKRDGAKARVGLLLALATVALMLLPAAAADPTGSVRVLNRDATYEREVIAGEPAEVVWIVYNSGNASSYNVRTSIEGTYGTWALSVEPGSFTIPPDSVQEVSLRFQPRSSNLGETYNIVVRFNMTEIASGVIPDNYEVRRNATLTVVARQVIDEHGITILGNHFGLPGFLDNDWGRFLIFILIWVIVGALAVGVIQVLKYAASKTDIKYDDIVLEIVRIPTLVLIVLYGLTNSLSHVRIEAEMMAWIVRFYYIGLILVAAYVGYKTFKRVLIVWLRDVAKKTETELDDILVPVFDKIGTIVILVVTGIFLLNYLGVNVTVFVAGMGVAGLVVAFAAQDTLSNFFAGMHLLLDRPFTVGETIILDNGEYCEVRHIGMRSTQLYNLFTVDTISIPNNKLANMTIVNVCRPSRMEKVMVEVGVSYDSDLDKVERLIDETVRAHPHVISDTGHEPLLRVTSFSDSSVVFRVFFVVDDFKNRWHTQHEVRKTLHKRFRREGVEIPFPQRVVHMRPK